jgi:hypothetical protein
VRRSQHGEKVTTQSNLELCIYELIGGNPFHIAITTNSLLHRIEKQPADLFILTPALVRRPAFAQSHDLQKCRGRLHAKGDRSSSAQPVDILYVQW